MVNLKSLFILIIFLLIPISYAISGSAEIKVNINNGSIKITDQVGNYNFFNCNDNKDITYLVPATCDLPNLICNNTCPQDIISFNATCNKVCPNVTIPKCPSNNFTCNPDLKCPEIPECPKPNYTPFWVIIFVMIIIIGILSYFILNKPKQKSKSPPQLKSLNTNNNPKPYNNFRQDDPFDFEKW